MQKHIVRGLMIGAAFVFAVAVVPASALAHEDGEAEDTTTSQDSARDTLKDRALEAQETRSKRLESAKLRVCQIRQKNIQKIMTRAVVRAENQVKVFTTISNRVTSFYVKKGNTLPNYDELVAAVDATKAKVQTDITGLQSQASFSCDSDDPKGSTETFKTVLKQVNEDLKTYRTAIKNLIVGVKSVQADNTGGTQ